MAKFQQFRLILCLRYPLGRLIHKGVQHVHLQQKIFIWMSVRGRIQIADEMKKNEWYPGAVGYNICGVEETMDHFLI